MIGTPGGSDERPALFFADAAEFRAWLLANHDTAPELWMGLYKKASGRGGLTWADAVPEALCFGWIDSQVQRIDEHAVRQRWTPRRRGSVWSKVNIDAVLRLTGEGRMHPAGLAAFEARTPERSGIYSFEQDELAELPPEYQELLDADPRAAAFFAAGTPGYRKICVHWVTSAKQQATRDKRMAQLVSDSAAGRLIPSQRYGDEPAWVARARAALG